MSWYTTAALLKYSLHAIEYHKDPSGLNYDLGKPSSDGGSASQSPLTLL